MTYLFDLQESPEPLRVDNRSAVSSVMGFELQKKAISGFC